MSASRSRNVFTLLLVVGAVVFGMVLAGGLDLTRPGATQPVYAKAPAEVIPGSAINGLPSFADLAEAVEPAVVSIAASTFQSAPQRGGVDPFEFFFGPRQRGPQPEEPRGESPQQRFRSDSGGSGFVISPDGLVITNNHVVREADQLVVKLGDRTYAAEVKGTDPATDLALLKIDAGDDLDYLRLGDSDALRVGDWVMAIGSPLSLDHSVTVGVVSAKRRQLGISDVSFENFIQTDAAINFGNSGGPLVNLRGEVVGINTAINFGAENIGFAVPANTLKQILPQLRESGRVSRGYLGIEVGNLDFKDAQAFGLETTDGALVQAVVAGEPAAEAGIQHGDIILKVDDVPVAQTRDLIDYVSSKPPGARVRVELLRNGDRKNVQVELGERPGVTGGADEPEGDVQGGIDWLGLQYQNLTPGLRGMHGIPEEAAGVWIIQVEPDSPLYDEGVRPGDLVSEVNGQPVSSVAELERQVEQAPSGSYIRFYVRRFDPRADRAVSFFAPVRKP
jgi:serine protease Do